MIIISYQKERDKKYYQNRVDSSCGSGGQRRFGPRFQTLRPFLEERERNGILAAPGLEFPGLWERRFPEGALKRVQQGNPKQEEKKSNVSVHHLSCTMLRKSADRAANGPMTGAIIHRRRLLNSPLCVLSILCMSARRAFPLSLTSALVARPPRKASRILSRGEEKPTKKRKGPPDWIAGRPIEKQG